jgi:hypothetical protein
MVALFLICFTTFVLTNRGRLRVDVFAVAAVAFAVLYFAFPQRIPSAGTGLDVRWLPVAYLLPFCVHSVGRGREARAVLLVPFVACLLAAGMAWRTTRVVDRHLAPFDELVDELPPNTALLPLISTRHPLGPIAPDWHFAFWHIIRNHGRVPRLFGAVYPRDGDPVQFNLLHFVEPHHLYLPPEDDWGMTPTLQPLDWARIAHDYDYIIEAGHDAPVRAYLGAHAREIAKADGVTLYEVARTPAAPRARREPPQLQHAAH